MAISKTSICNRALLHLGVTRINSYADDTSATAAYCREFFEVDRDSCLQMFPWSFAGKRVQLSPETAAPVFGWSYSFLLPADYLQMREVDDDLEYLVENGRILCDSDSISIAYTFKQTVDAYFSPLFVDMLSLKLARSLVGPLKRSTKDLDIIQTLYGLAEIEAFDAHSKESSLTDVDESDDILGRR